MGLGEDTFGVSDLAGIEQALAIGRAEFAVVGIFHGRDPKDGGCLFPLSLGLKGLGFRDDGGRGDTGGESRRFCERGASGQKQPGPDHPHANKLLHMGFARLHLFISPVHVNHSEAHKTGCDCCWSQCTTYLDRTSTAGRAPMTGPYRRVSPRTSRIGAWTNPALA